jgi:hypothetical protein
MGKLFISHAVHDLTLVKEVVDLLESGVGVPHRDIFCSSLKGQSIKPGKDFVDSIREQLGEAACVLALISESYYASAFCMCELGGVWVQSKSFLPVLVPPVDYSSLKAVLLGVQVSKIGSEEDLDELRDELAERLEIKPYATPRWTEKRKAFLEKLPALLKASTFIGPVPRATHDKLEKKLKEYKGACEAKETEVAKLTALVADLRKAKDKTAVARVIKKHASFTDQFEELTSAVKDALIPLPAVVINALYYDTNGKYYDPDRYDWDDVEKAVEQGQLGRNDDNVITPDAKDSKVRKALAAIKELSQWLDEPPEGFGEWYEETYDAAPELARRPFWDRHLT